MVNSLWDKQTDEVAAFEELVGSHGGLGGEQTRPFLLYPSEWPAPEGELFGAEAVHQQFRRWLAALGHAAYADCLLKCGRMTLNADGVLRQSGPPSGRCPGRRHHSTEDLMLIRFLLDCSSWQPPSGWPRGSCRTSM